MNVEIGPLGDQAVRVQFADSHSLPSIPVSRNIRAFCMALEALGLPGVIEWVPAYVTIAVFYRPREIGYAELVAKLKKIAKTANVDRQGPTSVVVVPTLYGGHFGPDLCQVSQWCGISEESVVSIHSSETYFVHMVGFAPGFPYLGVLPASLETPRRSEPRFSVPAGSVAITGSQTGIYSIETPGGWNIIGRTPISLYSLYRNPPSLLSTGDFVRFEPLTHETYDEIAQSVDSGEYRIRREIARA